MSLCRTDANMLSLNFQLTALISNETFLCPKSFAVLGPGRHSRGIPMSLLYVKTGKNL